MNIKFESCLNCRWYSSPPINGGQPRKQIFEDYKDKPYTHIGECRRHAPINQIGNNFPMMGMNDWCGDFKQVGDISKDV